MKKLLLSILIIGPFFTNAQIWNEKATGFSTSNRSLHSICIVDANTIWANAYDNTDSEHHDNTIKEFTKSTDGGNTWSFGTIDLGPNSSDMDISSITAVSATTAWISVTPGATNMGGIWKTTDGGLNWTKQATALFNDSYSFPNFVHFWDANNGIAQGDPENGEFEIYTTSNGGTNWTKVDGAIIPDPITTEYGIYNKYKVSGNTIWFGTDKGRIFKSSDKGLTWTANTTPSQNFGLDSFTFSDTNKGLLLIYNNPSKDIYKTTDGGANWTNLNLDAASGYYRSDIEYIPGTSIVFSVETVKPSQSYPGSSYSKDDGLTWTLIDNGVSHGKLAFLNSTFGFSGSTNTNATVGGIFKFSGLPLKTSSFNSSNTISTYPNPTNGLIHIDNGNTAINQVSVFDLLGRQVLDSKITPSTKTDLDLKSLQTGEYLIKVTSDSGKTETKKILKK